MENGGREFKDDETAVGDRTEGPGSSAWADVAPEPGGSSSEVFVFATCSSLEDEGRLWPENAGGEHDIDSSFFRLDR